MNRTAFTRSQPFGVIVADMNSKQWIAGATLASVIVGGGLLMAASRTPRPVVERLPAPRTPTLVVSRQALDPAARSSPVAKVVSAPTPSPSAKPYVVRRVLDIPEPIRFGQWYWDDVGVPAGPLVMTVDLAANTISVFRDGYEIGTAAVMTGLYANQTPLGRFPITQKDADHVSNIYHGAPMPYMLRLTNDGVSIHGGDVRADGATHGCVGVPVAFAKKLFAVAKLGDMVIITRGERLALGNAVRTS